MKKKSAGYGPNPADQPKVGDGGYMAKKKAPDFKRQETSSMAKSSATKKRAMAATLKKFKKTGLIPASPTR